MAIMQRITTFLWFDTQAEEAANYYASIFDDGRITNVSHYGSAGPRPAGMVMTVDFELDGCQTRTRWTTTGAGSPKAAKKARAAG
jgi:predicted 3-demethylubiquinone-9 3-methyltransferase (glyoxalase superfamily)